MSKRMFVISIIVIGLLINGFSFAVRANPAYEDYTTYDETDPSSDFAVVANTITVTTMAGGVIAHIIDDKEANHFGDFEHLVDFEITYAEDSSLCMVWGISDNI
ncbi:unnamed protein product [marine sediment metagenome]|uniref:Uncharacterized protein n=1 Tax=marine sediment metagenome TaxID=412755 RepID=X1ALD8_9ZZZZ